MKRAKILPRLTVFLITLIFTLSVALKQEYRNIYEFLQDEKVQQFTTQILQFGTSDFY